MRVLTERDFSIAAEYADRSLLARLGLWFWYHGTWLPDALRSRGTWLWNRRYRSAKRMLGDPR